MRSRTLLTQVLAVNAVLVAVTALVAAVVARERLAGRRRPAAGSRSLAVAVLAVILLNSLLLRRRLEPLRTLLRHDGAGRPAAPARARRCRGTRRRRSSALTTGFNRMLDRLEDERRAAGRAVLRAQEQERQRIAQDLHDEVNQALTAIKLRLSAAAHDAPDGLRRELRETKHLVDTRDGRAAATSPASCARPRSTTTA